MKRKINSRLIETAALAILATLLLMTAVCSLGKVQSRIADFAEHEGLHAHAKSVTIRFEDQ